MANENVRRVYEIDVKLAKDALEALRAMQQQLKDTEDKAEKARKRTREFFDDIGGGFGTKIAAFGVISEGFESITSAVRNLTLLDPAKQIAGIQAELERLRLGFAALNPALGLQGAQQQIDYVRNFSRQTGVAFDEAAKSFVRLTAASRGTNLAGKETRDIFESISLASRNLGLTTEQTANAFRAIEQAISKGVVQQEELRGQLSEALPGAVQIAARALNLTTSQLNNLIATGGLFADEFIPRFAAQIRKELGGNVEEGVNQATLALGNFENSYQQFKQSVTDSGLGKAAADQLNSITFVLDDVSLAFRRSKGEAEGFFGTLVAGANKFAQQKFLEKLNTDLADIEMKMANGSVPVGSLQESYYNSRIKLYRARIAELRAELKIEEEEARNQPVVNTPQQDFRSTELRREVVVSDSLSRAVEGLQKSYKDFNKERERELELLKQAKDAGKFKEDPAEYERLRKAILDKAASKDEDARASKKAQNAAEGYIAKLKEEIEANKNVLAQVDESKRLSNERAKAKTLEANLSGQSAAAFRREADALLAVIDRQNEQIKLAKAVKEATDESIKTQNERIRKLNDEAEKDEEAAQILTKSKEELIQLNIIKMEALAIETELTRAEAIRDNENGDIIQRLDEQAKAYRRLIAAKQGLLDEEYQKRVEQEILEADKREADSIKKRENRIKESLVDNFKKNYDIAEALGDTLADELGKRVFKVVIDPILDPLVKALDMVIDEFGRYLSEVMANAMKSGGGAGGGGAAGGIFSTIGSAVASFFKFANGGIMTGHGPLPLRAYANGGVASSPQLALFGEGRRPEAYVPLPDGRSIPVKMEGGGASAGVEVNVYNQGSNTEVATQEKTGPDGRKQLDVYIRDKVRETINKDVASGQGVAKTLEGRYNLSRIR